MTSIRMVFFLLFSANLLFAERIENFEYSLPGSIENWKVDYEKITDKCWNSKTIIYIPKDATTETSKEDFVVAYEELPGKKLSESTSKLTLQLIFQFSEVKIIPIEISNNSFLYEWSGFKDKTEVAHGWAREFSMPKENFLLLFRTEKLPLVGQIRPIWIKTLKEASFIEKN